MAIWNNTITHKPKGYLSSMFLINYIFTRITIKAILKSMTPISLLTKCNVKRDMDVTIILLETHIYCKNINMKKLIN